MHIFTDHTRASLGGINYIYLYDAKVYTKPSQFGITSPRHIDEMVAYDMQDNPIEPVYTEMSSEDPSETGLERCYFIQEATANAEGACAKDRCEGVHYQPV